MLRAAPTMMHSWPGGQLDRRVGRAAERDEERDVRNRIAFM